MEVRVCYLTDVTHDLQVQELHLWFLNQQIFCGYILKLLVDSLYRWNYCLCGYMKVDCKNNQY